VFAGDVENRCSAYVYLSRTEVEGGIRQFPDDVDSHASPLYCKSTSQHDVDMPTTSLEHFSGVYELPYSGYSIEDITIGDIVDNIRKRSSVVLLHHHADSEVKTMYVFASRLLCEPSTLMS
jgi:hypothetical protein